MNGGIKKILKKLVCASIVGLGADRRGKEMKKLLAVLIVLGLCGAAGATTVSFEDEGTTIITTPGGIVSLDIVTDWNLLALDAIVCITDGAWIIDVEYSGDPDEPPFIPLPQPPVGGPGYMEFGCVWFAGSPDGAVATIQIRYESGEVVVSLAPGDSFGGTWDAAYLPADFSDGIVTIIPEPATLLLLGLGAVLLRRRR